MGKRIRRKKILNTNKYQRQIISVAFLPTMVITFFMSFMIIYVYNQLINAILQGSEVTVVELANQWMSIALFSLFSVFLLLMIWVYYVSRHLVGAFERILRELDDVIDRKRSTPIRARGKDDLANDLLKRINVLIQRSQR